MHATSILSRLRVFIASAALTGAISGCDMSDDISDRNGQAEGGDEEGCDKPGKHRPPPCDENGEPLPPPPCEGEGEGEERPDPR